MAIVSFCRSSSVVLDAKAFLARSLPLLGACNRQVLQKLDLVGAKPCGSETEGVEDVGAMETDWLVCGSMKMMTQVVNQIFIETLL